MKNLLLDKRNLLAIFVLLLTTVVLNGFIFSNQLNYGFRDVDWQVLYYFKLFDNLSFNHLLQEVQVLGIYYPESYYVGILEKFIGLNFVQLHLVTHVFKIFAGLSIYLLILTIFKKRLLAFIASLLYTVSYTHAGVLFQLSSGGYFLTTISLASFLISYYFSLFNKNFLKWSIISSLLLTISLLLKPERMYPLLFLVILSEFFLISLGKFKKNLWITSLKRTFLIFLPPVIFYLFYNTLYKGTVTGFTPNQFSIITNLRIDSIIKGNLQLLIYPFSSLGSLFLYEDYWKILGKLNFGDLGSYITSLIFGPVIRLGIMAVVLLMFIYKKPLKLSIMITTFVFIFGLIIYVLNVNWQNISPAVRIHFDANLMAMPAILGFYISVLAGFFTVKWLSSKDQKLFPLVVGFSFSFLFILLTWLPSDLQLVFMGPQRYLSIPSIGTSLFISGFLVIIYDRIKSTKAIKNFAWAIFLLLIPFIIMNYKVTSIFFNYELTNAGLRGSEQIRMKSKFRQLVGKISQEERSLFYFDETADKESGYFDEGTVMAGFEFWTRVNMDGSLNNFPDPGMMRTNIQCPEHTHQNCVDILKVGLRTEGGQLGIWYKDPIRGNKNNFYKISNFHAYRFINKDIVDIGEEVLKELGL
ncbi:hypothetical protein KKE03_01810 [Patescibacteria group bacterium]|nr:hypothetical protein [Patescibacteria group bacterium]